MKDGEWVDEASGILTENQIPFHQRRRKNQVELMVSSGPGVQNLIQVLLPYLVVKRPLAQKLATFPKAPPRNRFTPIDRAYLDEICNLVDFVRRFNKSKNRKHKWNGSTIRAFFEE